MQDNLFTVTQQPAGECCCCWCWCCSSLAVPDRQTSSLAGCGAFASGLWLDYYCHASSIESHSIVTLWLGSIKDKPDSRSGNSGSGSCLIFSEIKQALWSSSGMTRFLAANKVLRETECRAQFEQFARGANTCV